MERLADDRVRAARSLMALPAITLRHGTDAQKSLAQLIGEIGMATLAAMYRDTVIATLRAHQQELRAVGVVSLSVFGSVARGESHGDSDIDVAVRLDANFSRRGLNYFERLESLERRLSHILGRRVDVVEEPARKPGLRDAIDRDRAHAF